MLSVCKVPAPGNEGAVKQNLDKEISLTLPAILGRGPLLKCAETKVSRRHSSLDWDEDGVIIQALHSNPTLVRVSGVVSSLNNGQTAILRHGDLFGLLPHAAWYRINLPGGCNNTNDSAKTELKEINSKVIQDALGPETTPMDCDEQMSITRSSTKNKLHINGDATNSDNKTASVNLPQKSTDILSVLEVDTNHDDYVKNGAVANNMLDKKENNELSNASVQVNQNKVVDVSNIAINVTEAAAAKMKKPNIEDNVSVTVQRRAAPAAPSHRARVLPAWLLKAQGTPTSTAAASSASTAAASSASTAAASSAKKRGRKPVASAPDDAAGGKKARRGGKNPGTPRGRGRQAGRVAVPKKTKEVDYMSESDDSDGCANVSSKRTSATSSPSKVASSSGPHSGTETPVKASPKAAKNCSPPNKKLHNLSNSDSGDDTDIICRPGDEDSHGDDPSPSKLTAASQAVASVAKTKEPGKLSKVTPIADAAEANVSDDGAPDNTSDGPEAVLGTSSGAVGGSVGNNSAVVGGSVGSTTAANKRKSCPFGVGCYRRNPQHKRDEAHPGDPDYREDSSDDDDGDARPECEFGVDCYRRNARHRREYKHTRLPQPQRQAKRKARAARQRKDADHDSDDSYDYDDPFLNDDSSDDYAPTDSESDSERFPSQPLNEEEKKDLKRMKKEAKKFIKRGK